MSERRPTKTLLEYEGEHSDGVLDEEMGVVDYHHERPPEDPWWLTATKLGVQLAIRSTLIWLSWNLWMLAVTHYRWEGLFGAWMGVSLCFWLLEWLIGFRYASPGRLLWMHVIVAVCWGALSLAALYLPEHQYWLVVGLSGLIPNMMVR